MSLQFFLNQPTTPSPFAWRQFRHLRFSGRQSQSLKFRCKASDDQKWKLNDIDADAVQQRLNSWLLKTQNFLSEVAAPLVKTAQGQQPNFGNALDKMENEELFVPEPTIESRTPNGILSSAAIVSIEQFSRMNGLTGRKMQKIFETLAPEPIRSDARNLVEYCCFRYLSRDSSDIHPCLKEPAFQRLIFITMLAWQQPYQEDGDSHFLDKNSSLQMRLVSEDAFVRIAPAISGVADRSTAHNLYKALVGQGNGIPLSLWTVYLMELCKVHEGRISHQIQDNAQISSEKVLCIGSSKKRPVLKWENNIAWPGKLTLTDKALYFEAIDLKRHKEPIRLDLTGHDSRVEKTKVGPLGYKFLDSAVAVSSGSQLETWVLEFVDFGGEMRRDVWHAFISEIIFLHDFICEYGPADDEPSIHDIYGAYKGKNRAITSAANGIARVQSLQSIRRFSEDPAKLLQFSYLRAAPFGDVVYQTLAVNFWGGPLITKFRRANLQSTEGPRISEELSNAAIHAYDIDGSVYLRRWMKSPSWASNAATNFWKNISVKKGVVLSKNLVVADLNLVERASLICKEKSQIVEKTQATIDAAMLKGIPSNIDLFKELMLPFWVTAKNFDKLRRWEEPHLTVSFLAFAYTIIFRNLLCYVLPAALMGLAVTMLLLKGLKEQGRLGRSFGQVTIRDQPPSNTIQKIVALKEAMADVESYLQNLNVSLLKLRTIILAGHPQITGEVALVLFFAATVLLIVPIKYVIAFLLFDLFTRELEFRREMVLRFMSMLRERWATLPAAPLVVLPFESDGNLSTDKGTNQGKPERIEDKDNSKKST